ncbi:MAG: hypothetical protein A2X29_00690 [Elusimicrobia bacterium GWA2_64_40]|nr:MAG: hypothetical protein A2X29_00690 [Elusimicrobia bacterium GWA2_64_40]OGR66158.1 MAG: hypothetical protein A2X30_09990 [Elusimicrobia bacterium GWB2_63_16]
MTGYKLYTSSAAGTHISLALNTSYYIDTGLEANKAYTRWLTVYDATEEGSDTEHLQKYTYAIPPAEIAISSDAPTAAPTVNSLSLPWARLTDTIVSTSAYVEIPPAYWFPNTVHASAYVVECSTDGGATYVRNRAFFVPWNTFPTLSNRHYMIRVGAVNGDEELTPGVYSATRTFTTPPLTPENFTAVAISSYSIQWRWGKDIFAGTDITGFKVYHSTIAAEDVLPEAGDIGEPVATLGANTSYWTEVYVDSAAVLTANSRHTRWIKAVGYLESEKSATLQKYTYAIAPGSATAVWLDPDPYWVAHVQEQSLSLNWPIIGVSSTVFGDQWRLGIASQYVMYHSTVSGFTVAVTSTIAGSPPQSVTGLTDNTKYDLRIGAINGDGEQTPDDAMNPYAFSQTYRVMTRPEPPSNYTCGSWTDTAMRCTWSTSTYVNADYIEGYSLGKLRVCHASDGSPVDCWNPLDSLAGVASHEYSLDYLETNSTHTISIWVNQQDPAWVAGNPHFDASPKEWEYYYYNFGSYRLDKGGATFATPPSDVAFDTVTARSISIWWKHPEVPATSYRIERATTTKEAGPWVFVSSSTGNRYIDSDLTPLTTYSYRLGAINLLGVQTTGLAAATNGQRRDYSFLSSTMTKHTSPAIYGVAYGTSAISWSWTDSTAGVLSYNIYDSTYGLLTSGLAPSATFWLEVNLSSANTSYTRNIASLRADTGVGEYGEVSAVTLANPPAALAATATGHHSISLAWSGNGGTRYSLSRSPDLLTWTPLKTWSDALTSAAITDSGLQLDTTYYYSVSAYNSEGRVSLSSATSAAILTLGLPAGVTAVYSTATIAQSITAPLPGVGQVAVSLPAGAITENGYVRVSTSAATVPVDISKASLDAATLAFAPNAVVTGSILELHYYNLFGAAMTGNFASPARVAITYTDANGDGVLDGVTPQAPVDTLKLLSLDTTAGEWVPLRDSFIDRTGKTVYSDISHFSFYSLGSIISAAGELEDSFAYPNPYRPGSSGSFGNTSFGEGIVFESLPARSRIKIYNTAGGLVREVSDGDGDGRCLWDGRNSNGTAAASGVYIYLVNSPAGGKKTGRISIIR